VTTRTVRNGREILRFEAQVVAAATSQRPGVVRWSELVVYQLPSSQYVISKIGRSVLAHRPECILVTDEMVPWLEAEEEAQVHRFPCLTCNPLVGDQMDPQTMLEPTRYTVLRARDGEELRSVLTQGRDHLPGIIRKLLQELDRLPSR
jgi:hypothetical protein